MAHSTSFVGLHSGISRARRLAAIFAQINELVESVEEFEASAPDDEDTGPLVADLFQDVILNLPRENSQRELLASRRYLSRDIVARAGRGGFDVSHVPVRPSLFETPVRSLEVDGPLNAPPRPQRGPYPIRSSLGSPASPVFNPRTPQSIRRPSRLPPFSDFGRVPAPRRDTQHSGRRSSDHPSGSNPPPPPYPPNNGNLTTPTNPAPRRQPLRRTYAHDFSCPSPVLSRAGNFNGLPLSPVNPRRAPLDHLLSPVSMRGNDAPIAGPSRDRRVDGSSGQPPSAFNHDPELDPFFDTAGPSSAPGGSRGKRSRREYEDDEDEADEKPAPQRRRSHSPRD